LQMFTLVMCSISELYFVVCFNQAFQGLIVICTELDRWVALVVEGLLVECAELGE